MTGFYVALFVLFGATFAANRSITIAVVMAAASGASFFAYNLLRRWISGRESLVLLESVWFALLCNAGVLWWIGQGVLPYLDLWCIAICPFLAAGRLGCTLVGCCHGRPATLGIAYAEDCARDGFARHLIGVRLFPVPALEGAGLILIGASAFAALPFAKPGAIFAWFLMAYAIVRFGLEGIRGDRRPHFLGLSQPRWMVLGHAALAIQLQAGMQDRTVWLAYAILALIPVASYLRYRRDWRRFARDPAHITEIRELASASHPTPVAQLTSQFVAVAASPANDSPLPALHISLSLPVDRHDLPLLCELAARAFPNVFCGAAEFTVERVLHLLVPLEAIGDPPLPPVNALYGCVVRRLQQRPPAAPAPPPEMTQETSAWYFAGARSADR